MEGIEETPSCHGYCLVSIRNKRLEIVMHDIYAELLQPDFGHVLLMEATSTMILIELARYVRQLDRQSSKHGASRISRRRSAG